MLLQLPTTVERHEVDSKLSAGVASLCTGLKLLDTGRIDVSVLPSFIKFYFSALWYPNTFL